MGEGRGGDSKKPDEGSDATAPSGAVLAGTTLRVYRFLFKAGKPMNIHDVQRGLGLSSASVAQYHLRKLLQAGLVKEEESGLVVDRIVFENMVRIRRTVIPFQIAYTMFFATLLVVLLVFLRNSTNQTTSLFLFALAATTSALVLFAFEAIKTIKQHSI